MGDSEFEQIEYSLSQGAAEDSEASDKTLECVRITFRVIVNREIEIKIAFCFT
jgi:hypothetical protein